ncbi:MAG: rRNA maturation RNase YbeY [Lachnospiraceae bacterium]|nr:rRNA maturation RNase YbeY [Lachnospiraceae bacterium]
MIFFVENDTDFDPDAEAGVRDLPLFCEQIGDEILKREGIGEDKGTMEASLYLVGEDAIRELNLMHRNINAATDVLSFPNIDFETPGHPARDLSLAEADITDPETGHILLGDIVINTARVLSQAREFGHSTKRELAFLITHSLLHLLGYDHMTPEEAAVMESRQEETLAALGITRS